MQPADDSGEGLKTYEDVTSRQDDDQVLSGPQGSDEAIKQEDIDALFS